MNSTVLYLLIGVLVYVAFFRRQMLAPTPNVTQNPYGGAQQQNPQSEFDAILGLIQSSVEAIGNVVSSAQTSVQRN